MLILTRRVGESIQIGDDIQIVLLAIKGNQIRIGIEAPKNIPIVRTELLDKAKAKDKNEIVPTRYYYDEEVK